MSFYVVLIIIIVALIGILVLNQRYSNSKIDTEVYARKQLIKKNKALSAENAELRSQMLSSNNDVGHHAYKNAKRELRKILDSYLENGKLKILRYYRYKQFSYSNIRFSSMHVHLILSLFQISV